MVWLDLEASGVGPNDLTEIGHAKGLKLMGGRIVVHYRKSLIFLRMRHFKSDSSQKYQTRQLLGWSKYLKLPLKGIIAGVKTLAKHTEVDKISHHRHNQI